MVWIIMILILAGAIWASRPVKCPECDSKKTNFVPYDGGYNHCNNCHIDF